MATASRPRPRPVTPRPRPRPTSPGRPPQRTWRLAPKDLATTRTFVTLGSKLLGRVLGGAIGLILTPSQLGDGTLPAGLATIKDIQLLKPNKAQGGGSHKVAPWFKLDLKSKAGVRSPVIMPIHVLEELLPRGASNTFDRLMHRVDYLGRSEYQVEQLQKASEIWSGDSAARTLRRYLNHHPVVVPPPGTQPEPRPQPKPPVAKPKPHPRPSKPPRPSTPPKPSKPPSKPPIVPEPPAVPEGIGAPWAPPAHWPALRPEDGGMPEPLRLPQRGYSPEIVIEGRLFHGRPQLRIRSRLVPMRPRARPERDRKTGRRGYAWALHAMITGAWGAYTEAEDVWELLQENLYDKQGSRVAAMHGAKPINTFREWIAGNVELDVMGFLQDFALNQVQDEIIGRMSSAMLEHDIGGRGDFTTQQRMNSIRRQSANIGGNF